MSSMIRIFNPYSGNFLKMVVVFGAIFFLAYCKTNSKTQANLIQERYTEVRQELEGIYNSRITRGAFAGLFQTKNKVQSNNAAQELEQVCIILEKTGWPSIKSVGENANTAVWMVMLDADNAIKEQYLPLLRASVAKGESNPAHLAFIEDKILVSKGLPQMFGTQLTLSQGQTSLYPVANPDALNRRRKSIGLEPIEVYLASVNQL